MDKVDFINKYERYYAFDKPIPYKGLNIYPVMVSDYYDFFDNIYCLELDKMSFPEFIKLSYLDFLFKIIFASEDGVNFLIQLLKLFNLCFHININFYDGNEELLRQNIIDGQFFNDNKGVFNFNINEKQKIDLYINNIKINKKDFNNIKSIILYTNVDGYDETYINPELKEELEEQKRLMQKDISQPSIEKKQATILCASGINSFNEFNKMTIRKFNILFEQAIEKIEYQINKTASMSGMVEFKEAIPHWVFSNNDINNYSSQVTTLESIQNKLSNVT